MANMRRARKAVVRRRARRAPDAAALQERICVAAFDMEEPLREARALIHILGAISQYRGEDNEAVSTVAEEANGKLEVVDRHLRRIYAVYRKARS